MNEAKVMIITGTARGIGKYLAEYYLGQGYMVAGCSRATSDINNDCYTHFQLDVADEKAVKNMVTEVYKRHRRIHVLLNNAGIASMNHTLLTPLSTVETMFRTNFYGTFLFSREVGKVMTTAKYGRIVNFLSVAVPLKLEGESVYAASKSAIETFTKILARELGSYNITCNNVGPSPVETGLIRSVPPEKIKNIINSLAIKRMTTFRDISNVIDFFIREDSDYITGQTIYLGSVQ